MLQISKTKTYFSKASLYANENKQHSDKEIEG